MPNVREFPEPTDCLGRVETGAIQFGGDWPGLFIRGDNALMLACDIDIVLKKLDPDRLCRNADSIAYQSLRNLREMIHEHVLVKKTG